METQSPFEQFEEIRIDGATKGFLAEIAKWTSFFAILGFIGIGFMVIAALIFMSLGASLNSYNSLFPMGGGLFVSFLYLILAVLYFFPVNYLYKFSSNMKNALRSNNQQSLTRAFEYLKSHYKFVGILTIVMLSLYILLILIAILTGLRGFMG